LAAAFFITSISLAYLATSETTVDSSQSIMVQTVSEDATESDLPATNNSSSDVPEN
jgi:preprotein translocase subunit SecG